eukprot:TRINITY_DN11777_c0_g1_i1.p1 TRINITY_DN11777_c0_g1~~TRINITY_DN11777_c0_g1_i1.p1  ORF type:complete len:155 (+),score=34.61 TRINITY_DN11777_c0_g1_i1:36-467(+)
MSGPFGGLLAPCPRVGPSEVDFDCSLEGIIKHSASPKRGLRSDDGDENTNRIMELEQKLLEAEKEANYLRHRHQSLLLSSCSPARDHQSASRSGHCSYRIVKQREIPLDTVDRLRRYQALRERVDGPRMSSLSQNAFLVPIAP